MKEKKVTKYASKLFFQIFTKQTFSQNLAKEEYDSSGPPCQANYRFCQDL